MTIIIMTCLDYEYDKNGQPISNKKFEYVSHGVNITNDKIVILEQCKLKNCNFIKYDNEYGWVLK